MYKVYVKTDEAGRITSVNSDAFLPDVNGWALIDEGDGDRYHHAQGNYLLKPLIADEGVYRYKLADGKAVERTAEEIQADIDALPAPPPSSGKILAAATLAFQRMAAFGDITEEEAIEYKEIFPEWKDLIGKPYREKMMFRHGDDFYKVNDGKSGTFQLHWPPNQTASEYSKIGNPQEEWPEWIQPTGAHNAYAVGDKVTHDGKRWISTADSNTWVPGVYGWDEAA